MAFPKRSSLREILPLLKTQLVNWQPPFITTDQIWIRRHNALSQKNVPSFIGDIQVILSPGGLSGVYGADGGGRVNSYTYRRVFVTLRTRMDLDESYKDDDRILGDATGVGGHEFFEDTIIDCLQMFQPTDTAQDWCIREPIRIIGGSDAMEEDAKNPGWTKSELVFEVAYTFNLNQAFQ
jgi:hypothetical protein